ncbi:MAG: hypothetical protein WCK77_22065 [Verrucomicrobiota bacterium]
MLAYIEAFAAGIIGYRMAGNRIAKALTVPAVALCVLGLISFLVEASHWLWDHHRTWIVVCPAASLLLAGFAIVRLYRNGGGAAGLYPKPPAPH